MLGKGWTLVPVSALVSLGVCANGARMGRVLGVLSYPDSRRLHRDPTPQVGGLAIMAGLLVFIVGILILDPAANRLLLLAEAVSASTVGLAGLLDDRGGLTPQTRIFCIALMLLFALTLNPSFIAARLNWGGLPPTPIPPWGFILLIEVTAVGLVNAVNMADGTDGLVGAMFAIWSVCLMLVTRETSAAMSGALCASTSLFLAYNLRGKLFLGNCGSYGVTFALGLIGLLAHARGQLSLGTITVWFLLPVVDCLRLMFDRMRKGRSPFSPDRDHFHHRLEATLGQRAGTAAYCAAVAATSLTATLNPHLSAACLALLVFFYVGVVARRTAVARFLLLERRTSQGKFISRSAPGYASSEKDPVAVRIPDS